MSCLLRQAVTIVGGGRIGSALVDMCKGPVKLVKRGEPIGDDETTGPIIVCTRNDALGDVLEATPKQRWEGAFGISVLNLQHAQFVQARGIHMTSTCRCGSYAACAKS
eukprot:evm.model.scf_714EXC.6 EVM.evm.TU.scf_714EXC.6   scf_714EXC:42612-43193(-)